MGGTVLVSVCQGLREVVCQVWVGIRGDEALEGDFKGEVVCLEFVSFFLDCVVVVFKVFEFCI